MLQLSLTEEEATRLHDVLTCCLSELRSEIAATDAHGYRERLKDEASFLRRIVAQLAVEVPVG